LLDAFLARPFNNLYHPTIQPRVAVNTVELPGGRQCYLILKELGESEAAVLDNKSKLLDQCDVIVYTYDSSDPDSFAYIPNMRKTYPYLEDLPSVYVALKADLDRTTQRVDHQPEEYTAQIQRMPQGPPISTSVTWPSIQDLFVVISEAGLDPVTACPRPLDDDDNGQLMRYGLVLAAVVCAGAAAVVIWRRSTSSAG
jgi:Ras family protein T1